MAEKREARRERYKRCFDEETREHLRAARREIRESYKALLPPEFVDHRRAARREMLLAVRSLIDRSLERMGERESD